MDQDRQDGLPASPILPRAADRSRRGLAIAGVLAACALLAAGAYWLTNNSLPDGHAQDTPPDSTGAASSVNHAQMFVGWTKPDFVLVLTGQSHGYLQPCGCSSPQFGGLARRWEFFNSLTRKGWTLIPIDSGEIAPVNRDTPPAQVRTPHDQNMLKYATAMRALAALGYQAVGLGQDEFQADLVELLSHFSLNNKRPKHLALNLDGNPPGIFRELGVGSYEIVQAGAAPPIGVVGIIGAKVADQFKNDAKLKITWGVNVLPGALKALEDKSKFNVLIFQGLEDEAEKCAKWCAEQRGKQPGLAPVHVVLHNNHDAEPPGVPREVEGTKTQLITVGHKGKYVGVLGVWRTPNGFQTKYQMVAIGPEFDPGRGNPIVPLMEDYAKKVKDRNLVAQFLIGPHKRLFQGKKIEARYVGSERCLDCHEHAAAVWSETGHAHAFETLEKATKPSLRQFDGECLQCHTVGFKHDTGYNDRAVSERMKGKLRDVGCESCHGPASMHVNDPNNKDYYPLINEFAAKHNPKLTEDVRLRRLDFFCQNCHDTENDVHWNFKEKWPKVIHMTPKQPPQNGK